MLAAFPNLNSRQADIMQEGSGLDRLQVLEPFVLCDVKCSTPDPVDMLEVVANS